VARGKPAPGLFLQAAARTGADPARALVIEDTVAGIRAARAAGMAAWRFTGDSHLRGRPDPQPTDATPDLRFDDFAEVAPRFAMWQDASVTG
jgi:beta-phosphoglucomutase-like phosphatase (HAD superfamily)